jgi:pimeloyl-ACP methyl ester carboxylesterase
MKRSFLVLFVLLLVAGTARADIILLVHGYLGSAFSWQASGVNSELMAKGWLREGVIHTGRAGVLMPQLASSDMPHKIYGIDLPSTASLLVQSDLLTQSLRALEQRYPEENITLVGHSAGGVVARMALVRGGAGQVTRLITIASPHMGTVRALQALDATDGSGPIGFFKDMFGGDLYHTVKHSWPILVDLAPPAPGNALFWLNAQPHPDIEYISVVRREPSGFGGDQIAPAFSQNMNSVPALRGRSRVIVVPADHGLTQGDGALLAQLMRA